MVVCSYKFSLRNVEKYLEFQSSSKISSIRGSRYDIGTILVFRSWKSTHKRKYFSSTFSCVVGTRINAELYGTSLGLIMSSYKSFLFAACTHPDELTVSGTIA